MEREVFYYHGKTTDGYRFTLAGRFQPMPMNGDNQEVDAIMFGAALCSDDDQFERKEGRMKAEGRMKSVGPKGRNFFSLYNGFQTEGQSRLQNWFEGQEIKVFLEAATLNEALSRKGFMSKFRL